MLPHAVKQDARIRSSVVRPIAMCSPSWRFFKRTPLGVSRSRDARLWAVVWPIGPLPAWHVERPRKSLKWLLTFVVAISYREERFLGLVCARIASWKIIWTPRLATKCLQSRTLGFYDFWFYCRLVQVTTAKDRSYYSHVRHLTDVCLTLCNSVFFLDLVTLLSATLHFLSPNNEKVVYVS